MYKLSKIQKRMLCYLGLAVMFVLMGDSNNVPDIFAERIFKPIKGNSWGIYYAGLIVIVGIYYCLKQLNKIRESFWIRTTFRRIVVTIVLMSAFPSMWVYCIQFYKGFSKDLNSIYLNRQNTLVQFYENENTLTINGTIDIKNCSDNTQEFQIKIKAPFLVKEDVKEEYLTLEDEFKVNPKEEKTLSISEELKFNRETKYSGYTLEAFEYILFNDKDEVVFKGKLEEYEIERWDLEK